MYFVCLIFIIPSQYYKLVSDNFISQMKKLNSERWSHLVKIHTTAKWQSQDLNSDASDFKAILDSAWHYLE